MWGKEEVTKILDYPDYPELLEWSLADINAANELTFIATGRRVVPLEIMAIWDMLADIFPPLRTGPFLDGIQRLIDFFIIWIMLQTSALLLYWFVLRKDRRLKR